MKNTFLLFLALFLCFGIQAQTPVKELNKIIGQAKVTWVGSIESRISFNHLNLENAPNAVLNQVNLLKFFPGKQEKLEKYQKHYIDYQMVDLLLNTKQKLYKDKELSKTLTKEELMTLKTTSVDTIISFDEETFEEIVSIRENKLSDKVSKEFFAQDIFVYKLFQYIYYDEAKAMFFSYPISIAPVQKYFDDNGNELGDRTLFWIPIKHQENPIQLKKEAYSWAIQLNRSVHLSQVDLQKKKALRDIYKELKEKVLKQELSVWESPEAEQPLKDNLNSCFQYEKIDYDPAAFEESVRMEDLKPEAFKAITIQQNWAWDQKKMQLVVQSIGYAPVMEIEGEQKALFFIKNNIK